MKCTNKGKCCKELPDGTHYLLSINGNCVVLEVTSGACNHLIDGECNIYSDRPQVCEDWYCDYCQYA